MAYRPDALIVWGDVGGTTKKVMRRLGDFNSKKVTYPLVILLFRLFRNFILFASFFPPAVVIITPPTMSLFLKHKHLSKMLDPRPE